MDTNQLRKLSRKELLEIMLAQVERIDSLEKENKKLQRELSIKKINISESGSLAEASLKLSGIFESAQKAITIYKDNIDSINKSIEDKITKEFEKEKNKKLKEIDKFCDMKKQEANKILDLAKKEAKELKQKTKATSKNNISSKKTAKKVNNGKK